MIGRLSGTVAEIGADFAVIDCAGVGYVAQCSARTLGALPPVGGAARLLVETLVRQDEIRLLGFADRAERDWYRLLVTVQGVGPRTALSVLSVLTADELLAAVASGDKASIARAEGVGPKLAARVAAELKDRAGAMFLGALAGAPRAGAAGESTGESAGDSMGEAMGKAANDAISALVNLGYRQAEAFGAVAQAAQSLGRRATLDALIKAGLKELGR
ncbi:MAG: Holliday junction branch migration protein RuvA [Rhodospirillales bacterium]